MSSALYFDAHGRSKSDGKLLERTFKQEALNLTKYFVVSIKQENYVSKNNDENYLLGFILNHSGGL